MLPFCSRLEPPNDEKGTEGNGMNNRNSVLWCKNFLYAPMVQFLNAHPYRELLASYFSCFFFTFSKKQCSMFESTEKQSLVKLNWYWKATHHKNPWQIISTLSFAARNEQITTDFDLSHSEISTLWFVTGIYVALHSRIIVFNLTETVCFVALATKSNAFIWLIENQWPIIIH